MFMLIAGFFLGALLLYFERDDSTMGRDWGIGVLGGFALYFGSSIMLFIIYGSEFGIKEPILSYLPVLLFGVWLAGGFKDD